MAYRESVSGTAAQAHAAPVVCTLAEGTYFYGVAALVNSLVRAGLKAPSWLAFEGSGLIGLTHLRTKQHWTPIP